MRSSFIPILPNSSINLHLVNTLGRTKANSGDNEMIWVRQIIQQTFERHHHYLFQFLVMLKGIICDVQKNQHQQEIYMSHLFLETFEYNIMASEY